MVYGSLNSRFFTQIPTDRLLVAAAAGSGHRAAKSGWRDAPGLLCCARCASFRLARGRRCPDSAAAPPRTSKPAAGLIAGERGFPRRQREGPDFEMLLHTGARPLGRGAAALVERMGDRPIQTSARRAAATPRWRAAPPPACFFPKA